MRQGQAEFARVPLDKIDTKSCLSLHQPAKQVLQLAAAKAGQHADAQDVMVAARRLGRPIDGEIQFPDRALGAAHEILASQGQANTVRAAFEDRRAEPVFQFLDPPGNGRLLNAEMTRSTPEAAVLGRRQNVAQLMETKPRTGAGLAQAHNSKT